jgi:hypothetical protein
MSHKNFALISGTTNASVVTKVNPNSKKSEWTVCRPDDSLFWEYRDDESATGQRTTYDTIFMAFADLSEARQLLSVVDTIGLARSYKILIIDFPDPKVIQADSSSSSIRDSNVTWKSSGWSASAKLIHLSYKWNQRPSRILEGLGIRPSDINAISASLDNFYDSLESLEWAGSSNRAWTTPDIQRLKLERPNVSLAGSFAVGGSGVPAAAGSGGLTDSFQRRLIVGNGVSGLGRAVSWSDVDAGLVDVLFSDDRVFDFVPPVDVVAFNPRGFVAQPARGAALTAAGARNGEPVVRFLDDARETVHIFEPGHGVRESLVRDLRQFSYVGLVPREFSGPRDFLTVLGRLLVAGVPVWVVGGVPEFAAAYLGPDLVHMLDSFDPFTQSDVLGREEWSVAARRLARDRLSVDAYWERRLLQDPALDGYVSNRPSVSAIMCTMRAEFVPFALEQMQRQTYPDLEVVLVLHGLSREDPAIAQAIAGYTRPITVVEVPPGVVFGGALNRGVAASHGEYISKIDDDDWYGEHHISDLVATRSYAPADLIGGPAQLVYMASLDMTLFRIQATETYGGHVAGASSLMSRDVFHSTGGWRQVNTHEDAMMIDSMNRSGGRVYRMHGMGFIRLRRSAGHTSIGGHDRFWSTHDASAFETYDGFRIPAAMTVESKYLPTTQRAMEWRLTGAGRIKSAKDPS